MAASPVLSNLENAATKALRESVWRGLMNVDEELEQLDRFEQRGMSAIEAVLKDNIERLQRGRKHFTRACDTDARKNLIPKPSKNPKDELVLQLDETALSDFRAYVTKCGDVWTEHAKKMFENDMKEALHGVFGKVPELTESTPTPKNRMKMENTPPKKNIDVLTKTELILRFWGTHKDMALIPATMLGLVYFVTVPWTEHLSKQFTSAGTALVVPILYLLGRTIADKERRRLTREAYDAYETAVLAFVKEEVTDALLDHEAALTRWLQSRSNQWKQAVAKHNAATYLEANKQPLLDKRRELVLRKKQLEEEERALRSDKPSPNKS